MPETLSGAREIKGKESLLLNVFGRWGGRHETEIRDKNRHWRALRRDTKPTQRAGTGGSCDRCCPHFPGPPYVSAYLLTSQLPAPASVYVCWWLGEY